MEMRIGGFLFFLIVDTYLGVMEIKVLVIHKSLFTKIVEH